MWWVWNVGLLFSYLVGVWMLLFVVGLFAYACICLLALGCFNFDYFVLFDCVVLVFSLVLGCTVDVCLILGVCVWCVLAVCFALLL